MEFIHSGNLSCNSIFMAGQFLLAECISVTYFCSDPLDVTNATLSGSLHETVNILTHPLTRCQSLLQSYHHMDWHCLSNVL